MQILYAHVKRKKTKPTEKRYKKLNKKSEERRQRGKWEENFK